MNVWLVPDGSLRFCSGFRLVSLYKCSSLRISYVKAWLVLGEFEFSWFLIEVCVEINDFSFWDTFTYVIYVTSLMDVLFFVLRSTPLCVRLTYVFSCKCMARPWKKAICSSADSCPRVYEFDTLPYVNAWHTCVICPFFRLSDWLPYVYDFYAFRM